MTDSAIAPSEGPKGIGGWLILPMLGTILSPMINAFGIFQNIDALFKYSQKLSTTWTYFVIGETIVALAMFVAWIIAAFMLFQHRRPFPILFVSLLAATLVWNLIDVAGVVALFGSKLVDPSTIRDIVRPLIALLIWGPYMSVSKRVKNTFVN